MFRRSYRRMTIVTAGDAVTFRVSENTWFEAAVRYLVDPKEAGQVKTRLTKGCSWNSTKLQIACCFQRAICAKRCWPKVCQKSMRHRQKMLFSYIRDSCKFRAPIEGSRICRMLLHPLILN